MPRAGRDPVNLATGEAWTKIGAKLHKRAQAFWKLRYNYKGAAALAETLSEIRRLELYKDLGQDTWMGYLKVFWGPRSKDAYYWSLCGSTFSQFPDEVRLIFPGVVSLRRLALFGPLCEGKQDFVWWARLARLTNFKEFERVVDGYRQAMRSGISGYASTLIVAGVLSEHYDSVVEPAFSKARHALGREATQGQCLTFLCCAALGVPLPDTLGVDSGALRRAPRPDLRLDDSGQEASGRRPRVEGGIEEYSAPDLTEAGPRAVDKTRPGVAED